MVEAATGYREAGEKTPDVNQLAISEIKDKVDNWETMMKSSLGRFNTYADYWRIVEPPRSASLDGFANPQVSEVTRATEALAGFMYRAITSADPDFALMSHNPYVSQEDLYKSEATIMWQRRVLKYKPKLLKGLRSLALMGSVPMEAPWTSNNPYFEGTDLRPRSLLQVAFDPFCMDISMSPWFAVIDFYSETALRDLGRQMPDVYDSAAIEECIRDYKGQKDLSPEIRSRLVSAGYMTYTDSGSKNSKWFQVVTYHGCLQNDPEYANWTVAVVNETKQIRRHQMVFDRLPLGFGHINAFELEPYGYGAGRFGELAIREMNANRGRVHDTITFSLFNMWLASRMANLKSTQMKIKPWGVLEVEGNIDESIKPLRPQLEAANYGLQMETLLKQEYRSTVGASDQLQAIVTDATATEASLAQNEAIRRLSVMSEVVSDDWWRDHLSMMHANNVAFLDQPYWIAVTGKGKVRVYPNNHARDAYVVTKTVTDKDFRPQRNKDILQFIQVLTSIRNQITPDTMGLLLPFIQEFARSVQVDPQIVENSIKRLSGTPAATDAIPAAPTMMDRIRDGMGAAESVRSDAGSGGSDALAAALGGAQ